MKMTGKHDSNNKQQQQQQPNSTSSNKRLNGDDSSLRTVNRGFLAEYKWYLLAYSIAAFSIAYPYVYNNYILKRTFTDCGDYFRNGHRVDGVYEIAPDTGDETRKLNVYCNMTAGGWTMIMRRDSASPYKIDFQVPLQRYKFGFGDLNADHFLGLDNIHLLTTRGGGGDDRQLMAIVNNTQYKYNRFRITDEFYHYKLIISQEIDKFADGASFLRLNNTLFSAMDVDYDLAPNSNCSSGWNAGWWFTNCFDFSICSTCLASHGSEGIKRLTYAAMLIK